MCAGGSIHFFLLGHVAVGKGKGWLPSRVGRGSSFLFICRAGRYSTHVREATARFLRKVDVWSGDDIPSFPGFLTVSTVDGIPTATVLVYGARTYMPHCEQGETHLLFACTALLKASTVPCAISE